MVQAKFLEYPLFLFALSSMNLKDERLDNTRTMVAEVKDSAFSLVATKIRLLLHSDRPSMVQT